MNRNINSLLFKSIVLVLVSSGFLLADKISYNAYVFSDNRKNEVFTSSFALAKQIFAKTMFLMDVELDQVTTPPITDGVSGASRPAYAPDKIFKKNRGQVILGLEQEIGQNSTLTANMYASRETDYESQSLALAWTQEMLQKNLTLNLRGQYNLDRVGYISQTQNYSDSVKEVRSGSISLSQLLSPTTILSLGADYSEYIGFLSDPYRSVVAAGDTLRETHPNYRYRYAGCLGLKQYIPSIRFSFHINYRYYMDQWEKTKKKGMESHTISLKLNKYVTKNLIISPNYRYYTQSATYFNKTQYSGNESLFSNDYKLRAFNSNNFGVSADYYLRGLGEKRPGLLFLENARLSLEYFRYINTQDFSANIFQTTLAFEF